MIHIITSNTIPIDSIKSYADNFMICHLMSYPIIPHNPPKTGYHFDLYHLDGMELPEEDYENNDDMVFQLIPTDSITGSLDAIVMKLKGEYDKNQDKDPDLQEEMTVAVCCDYKWSRQVHKYLNSQFIETCPALSCLDLYTYLRVPSTNKMGELLKVNLNSEFIYPEDPTAFGFALYQAIRGRL